MQQEPKVNEIAISPNSTRLHMRYEEKKSCEKDIKLKLLQVPKDKKYQGILD